MISARHKFSLRLLPVLCASEVHLSSLWITAETQRAQRKRREKITRTASAFFVMMLLSGLAHSQFVKPPEDIKVVGVPPVPVSLVREVEPYTGMYGLPLVGWERQKREILLKGMSSVAWISRLKTPLAAPETEVYIRTPDVYDLYLQPQGKFIAYTADASGSESFQLFVYDPGSGKTALLSDNKSRNTEPVWSTNGDLIAYSSTPINDEGVNLRLVDPRKASSDRLMVQSSAGYLKAYDWSPDDKEIVYCDFSTNTASTLWTVEVATGKRELLSPKSAGRELYDLPQFSVDGKRIYVITDHGSEFRRLAYIDLTSKKLEFVSPSSKSDVEEFQLAPNGKWIAFVTNETGFSKLNLIDSEGIQRQVPAIPQGVISDLKWHLNSADLAFNLKSANNPNEVYTVNIESGALERWSKGVVNEKRFSTPEPIEWSSFDKRRISGFLYRPLNEFKGKRPVIIELHGGPEEQFRPAFNYTDNYFIDELGIVKIYPNVRGSTGYGRTFEDLDNGLRREDAVKDIGALLDWIKTQPDLDAERVLIEGASYGGYLALSAACRYSDRIRGTISDSGISNLASFVARTEGWRRGLQRSEFGDERDSKIKEFMERTAPVANAAKIKTPLLIIQGENDPRVPVGEAEKIVAATKDRIPVWYILGKNEGHGFSRPDNRKFQLYATILFIQQFLLK